jgi:predicted nucleic acid-binding protein
MKTVLFDSYAVLVYLQDEPGAERIKKLLEDARQGERQLVMQKINLGEVFYQVWRRAGAAKAEEFRMTFCELPVGIIDPADDLIWAACRIKAEYPIALGDCFAAATARREQAILLTGDPEFKKLGDLVQVEWL